MDEMTMDEFAELSAGHALGALSADDAALFRAAREAHPEWEHVVALDEQTAAGLAEGIAPVAPPMDIRSKVLAAVAAPAVPSDATALDDASVTEDAPAADDTPSPSPAAPPTEVVQAVARRSWTRGLFALVASFVLLVGIGWGVGAVSNVWHTPASVTALNEIRDAPDAASAQSEFDGGTATVHWSQSLGKVVLVADGLPEIASDRTFELWYVRGDSAIPAGTFSAQGGESTAELSGTMQPGDVIAVTVEPAGGAPDGTPTTTPILAVSTA
ncbi:anti-sigma factor [Microbacterium flavum]|uniref:anti-sigma factor n=1 Tax=Microbacterium flavum TaxID=415216 RepID=UPI0031F70899